ncbi:MAG: hypothetical protein ACI83D_000445 [Planctomycetota bacterium]|jgi:hypothetical protein
MNINILKNSFLSLVSVAVFVVLFFSSVHTTEAAVSPENCLKLQLLVSSGQFPQLEPIVAILCPGEVSSQEGYTPAPIAIVESSENFNDQIIEITSVGASPISGDVVLWVQSLNTSSGGSFRMELSETSDFAQPLFRTIYSRKNLYRLGAASKLAVPLDELGFKSVGDSMYLRVCSLYTCSGYVEISKNKGSNRAIYTRFQSPAIEVSDVSVRKTSIATHVAGVLESLQSRGDGRTRADVWMEFHNDYQVLRDGNGQETEKLERKKKGDEISFEVNHILPDNMFIRFCQSGNCSVTHQVKQY